MKDLELTREQAVLLNLATRSAWVGEDAPVLPSEALEGVDWPAVMKMARAQAVPLAAFQALALYRDAVPAEVYASWERLATKVVLTNLVVAKERRALHELMGDIPYVVLKGAAAAAYYPDPELRVAGDVDFLVRMEDRDRVSELLVQNGYAMSYGDHANHWVYTKGNAHLEMHFEVAGVPFGEKGKAVNAMITPCITAPVIRSGEDGTFLAPDDMHHALIILLHMQHHMLGDGLGLRHIIDWVAFVNKTRSQDFWEELINFLKEIGLWIFTATVTRLAVNYLGLSAPEWLTEDLNEVAGEVLVDVFTGGNFGVNDKNRSASGMLISENGKDGTKHGALYNLAHNLHGAVLRQYPIVKRVWIFYPFVYAYKAVRFLVLSALGKRPSLTRMRPEAEKRRAIYEKLRVFETERKEK